MKYKVKKIMEIRYRIRDVKRTGKKIATHERKDSSIPNLPQRRPKKPKGKTLVGIVSTNQGSYATSLDGRGQYQEFLNTVQGGLFFTGVFVRGELYEVSKSKIKPYRVYN